MKRCATAWVEGDEIEGKGRVLLRWRAAQGTISGEAPPYFAAQSNPGVHGLITGYQRQFC